MPGFENYYRNLGEEEEMASMAGNFTFFSLSTEFHSDGATFGCPEFGESMLADGGRRRGARRKCSSKIRLGRVKRLGKLRQRMKRRVVKTRDPVSIYLEARRRRARSYAKLKAKLTAMEAKLDAMKSVIEETSRLIDRWIEEAQTVKEHSGNESPTEAGV